MYIDLLWHGKTIDSVLYNNPNYSRIPSSVQVDFSKWPVIPNQVRCHLRYDGNKFIKQSPPYHPNSIPYRLALIVESPHKDEFSYDFNPLQPLSSNRGRDFDSKILTRIKKWNIPNLKKNQLFEIKIFNPVQYQTSLYHFLSNLIIFDRIQKQLPQGFIIPNYGSLWNKHNSLLRNSIWKILFTNPTFPCEAIFKNELSSYNPSYIVNACTGSGNPKLKSWHEANQIFSRRPRMPISNYSIHNLKAIVRRSIFSYFNSTRSGKQYIEEVHPCKWK